MADVVGLGIDQILVIFTAFFLAGTVKGLAGLGLPLVSLGTMVLVIDFKTALAIMTIPAFISNAWQAVAGPLFWVIVRKLRSFLVIGSLLTLVMQLVSQQWDDRLLTTILGLTVVLYTGTSLLTRPVRIRPENAVWLNPVVAAISGLLAGMTGSFALPAAVYFQALGLKKDEIVQTLGIWFTLGALALTLGVTQSPAATGPIWIISVLATLPVLIGMHFGQKARARFSESFFRRLFLSALCIMGAWLAFRGLFL